MRILIFFFYDFFLLRDLSYYLISNAISVLIVREQQQAEVDEERRRQEEEENEVQRLREEARKARQLAVRISFRFQDFVLLPHDSNAIFVVWFFSLAMIGARGRRRKEISL